MCRHTGLRHELIPWLEFMLPAPNWELHAAGVARRPRCENAVAKSCRETWAAASTRGKQQPFRQALSEIHNTQWYEVIPAFLNADNCTKGTFEKELWSHFVQVMYSERWCGVGWSVHSRASRKEGAERRMQAAEATVLNLHQDAPQTPKCFCLAWAPDFSQGERQKNYNHFINAKLACSSGLWPSARDIKVFEPVKSWAHSALICRETKLNYGGNMLCRNTLMTNMYEILGLIHDEAYS